MSTKSEQISSKNMEVSKESESVINDEINHETESLNQGLNVEPITACFSRALKERVNFENNKIAKKVFAGKFEIENLTFKKILIKESSKEDSNIDPIFNPKNSASLSSDPKINPNTEVFSDSYKNHDFSTQDEYLQKFEESSLSSDSAIDPDREISSDSYDDDDCSSQDDSIQKFKDNVESIFAPFEVYKQKQIVSYTVDDVFFDHWCCKSKMNEDKLNNILKVWASDNWEGLYDPPIWLTVDMFCMALTDEMSNIMKSEKIIEAKINLEMARLTTTKVMPDILKKGAMKYLENLMQMSNMNSNDNFTEEMSLAIFMHIIYKKMEDIYTEQNLKLFKLKIDLKQIFDDAVQEWRNMIEFYEKISISYVQHINLLQDLRSK